MLSRYSDIVATTAPRPSLPVIDWSLVKSGAAPVVQSNAYHGARAPLPQADIVILTWTSAEWSAFDHVFVEGNVAHIPASATLETQWHLYSRNAPSGSASGGTLWGYYRLVTIQGVSKNFTVLLLKSDAHLAHPPYITGLTNLLDLIVQDVAPTYLFSIGTAGGANDTQRLGDTVITNSAHLQVTLSENTVSYNNQTFSCNTWFPSTSLLQATQDRLLFPLSNVVTTASLSKALQDAQTDYQQRYHSPLSFTVADLLNPALEPANLGSPSILPMQGTPLLTTDNYYIAPGNTIYAALEMDDAVVAHEAGLRNLKYVFVRNISDTLVPSQTPAGQPISPNARDSWSSAIYNQFGLYTSFNSAVAAWATIAGS